MNALISFFKGIGSAIVAVFDFIISFFQDLIYMIQLLGKFLGQIPNYFSWLPSEILAPLLLLFAIVVIYKILGREG